MNVYIHVLLNDSPKSEQVLKLTICIFSDDSSDDNLDAYKSVSLLKLSYLY